MIEFSHTPDLIMWSSPHPNNQGLGIMRPALFPFYLWALHFLHYLQAGIISELKFCLNGCKIESLVPKLLQARIIILYNLGDPSKAPS